MHAGAGLKHKNKSASGYPLTAGRLPHPSTAHLSSIDAGCDLRYMDVRRCSCGHSATSSTATSYGWDFSTARKDSSFTFFRDAGTDSIPTQRSMKRVEMVSLKPFNPIQLLLHIYPDKGNCRDRIRSVV